MSQERSVLHQYDHLLVADPRQFAKGLEDGNYIRVTQPFSPKIRHALLTGELCVSLYMLTPKGHAVQGIADSDKEDGLRDLQRLGFKLREVGIRPLLEASRRGGHLRFFHDPLDPRVTTLLLNTAMKLVDMEADVFPRHGLSCVRAPFSKHPKTGKVYPIIDLETLQPVAPTLTGQLEYLATFKRQRAEDIAQALATLIIEFQTPPKPHFSSTEVRTEITKPDILKVVSADIEVRKIGKNFRAKCPFHADNTPSLVLYPDTATFYCFGCQRSGDSIHYMALRQGVRDGEIMAQLRRT